MSWRVDFRPVLQRALEQDIPVYARYVARFHFGGLISAGFEKISGGRS